MAEHEVPLAAEDFRLACQLIYRHAGISLSDTKQAMVYSRLLQRLRHTGQPTFGAYLSWLQSNDASAKAEWQEFVNSLTTNLTSFFREEHHFTSLAGLLAQRAGSPIRLWCSAASTGEEPYSLAMVIQETLGPQANVTLMCSDIDTKVLATARRGVYAADARGLNAERTQRHFMRGSGTNVGYIRIKPDLARKPQFFEFNLMSADWSALGDPFDIVFCRNVMIYFDPPTQRKVLEHMHRVMKPKAQLFVGHSENFADQRDLFRLIGRTVYERV